MSGTPSKIGKASLHLLQRMNMLFFFTEDLHSGHARTSNSFLIMNLCEFVIKMLMNKKITIVATSHIAEQSVKKIEETVNKEKPDCIAVELDKQRYIGMKMGGSRPPIRELGVTTFVIFYLMKKIQTWLGKKVGILPGSEMLRAVDISQEKGIQLCFIDRNIGQTFMRIRSISLNEKLKLVFLLVKGIILGLFNRGEKMDLTKVPDNEIINVAMEFLKKELPEFYKVLVEERDEVMSNNILKLTQNFDNIVVVIGAGHKNGIVKKLGEANKSK